MPLSSIWNTLRGRQFQHASMIAGMTVLPPKNGSLIPAFWNGTQFGWSDRILLMGAGRGSHFASQGFFALTVPTVGTVIPGFGGAPAQTVVSVPNLGPGIPLPNHTTLYAVLPVGGTSGAATYAQVAYTTDFVVPFNWFPVASCTENTNSGMVQTCWGEVLDYWRTPAAFLNGWQQYSGLYFVRFKMVASRQVVMRGLMTAGTVQLAAFQLPVGYRPAEQIVLPAVSNSMFAELRIDSNGEVRPWNIPAAGSWFSVATTFTADN